MTWLLFLALSASAQNQGRLPTAPEPPPIQSQTALQSRVVNAHNGGLVTYYSGNRLKDDQSQVATNVLFDQDLAVFKRAGQSLYGTVPNCTSAVRSNGVLDAPSGTKYFFVACSTNAFITTGSGSFSVHGGTISSTANIYFKPGLGQLWVTDDVDYLWSTDGVTISSYTGAPICQIEGIFQSRLLLANCVGGQSTINLSGYKNGSDFTLPAVILDTSPAVFGLNGLNDGRAVTCMFDGFRDVAILWNHDEMYGLYGSGNSTFVLRKLAEIGCDEQESVQEFDGHLKWLSQFGVYEYDGLQPHRISDDVKDQIKNIIGTEPGSLSFTQNTQSQWQNGNLTASGAGAPMSATISPGNVVPGTWSVTTVGLSDLSWVMPDVDTTTNVTSYVSNFDNSSLGIWSANPNLGTFYVTANGRMAWSTSTFNSDMEASAAQTASTGTWSFVWTSSVNASSFFTFVSTLTTLLSSTSSGDINRYVFGCITDNFQIEYSTEGFLRNSPSGTHATVCDGADHYFRISRSSSGYLSSYVDGKFTASGRDSRTLTSTKMSLLTENASNNGGQQQIGKIAIPFFYENQVSTVYDVGFTTPTWGNYAVSLTSSSTSSVTFSVQSSAVSNSGFQSLVAQTPNATIAATVNRYLRHHVYPSPPETVTVSSVTSITLSAATTGYFIASCFVSSPIASWGALQANTVAGNGTVTLYVSSGPTCDSVQRTTVAWTAQTINQNISIATAPFLGVRALFSGFSVFIASTQPTLQSLTANWNNTAGRPRTASQVYDNRYWLAYTTNTTASAQNNAVLINDENGHWSTFTGVNAATLFTYQRQLYAGSSLGDGNVVLQNNGLTDLGSAISIDFRTPDYELDGFTTVDLYDLSLEFKQIPVTSTATPTLFYYTDVSSSAFSLGSLNLYRGTPGVVYQTARFGQGGTPTKAKSVGFEIKDTSFSPITFYRSQIRFTPEDGP